jgi:hypothetical protein
MADIKMNLRRDKPSPDVLDALFEIMVAIMAGTRLMCNTFFLDFFWDTLFGGAFFDAPGRYGHLVLFGVADPAQKRTTRIIRPTFARPVFPVQKLFKTFFSTSPAALLK